jgi:hypothetical protein
MVRFGNLRRLDYGMVRFGLVRLGLFQSRFRTMIPPC